MNESNPKEFDAAIIGGGLAGLSASILLARAGHKVILFEKEKYPFHKVCGEYISLESWNFLIQLGIPIDQMNLPVIDTLLLTAVNGEKLETKLPLGGFGISRHLLDSSLAAIARKEGVTILEKTKVEDVVFSTSFSILYHSKINGSETIIAKTCCSAFGKKSNLDIKWKRSFLFKQDKRLDNYVAVKYHITTDWQPGIIGLHNFTDGYCGISQIEENKYCLCYITKAVNLKVSGNSISKMEENILYRNPFLKKIFSVSSFEKEFPVTISQISFNKKTQVLDHMLMIGDAAGMITPLCGNGMSIAMHTGKISATLIDDFLKNKITRQELEEKYIRQWRKHFAYRLKAGRILQRLFGSDRLSNTFVKFINAFPFLAAPLVKMTHGKEF